MLLYAIRIFAMFCNREKTQQKTHTEKKNKMNTKKANKKKAKKKNEIFFCVSSGFFITFLHLQIMIHQCRSHSMPRQEFCFGCVL